MVADTKFTKCPSNYCGRCRKIVDDIETHECPFKNNKCEFSRGYFCAVGVLLEERGIIDTDISSLFRQGGDWKKADPCDIEKFKKYGLISS